MQKSVHFLGHVVSDSGVETDPDKIEKVKNCPVPKNADELCTFKAFTEDSKMAKQLSNF